MKDKRSNYNFQHKETIFKNFQLKIFFCVVGVWAARGWVPAPVTRGRQ